jgi:hypothetical protein
MVRRTKPFQLRTGNLIIVSCESRTTTETGARATGPSLLLDIRCFLAERVKYSALVQLYDHFAPHVHMSVRNLFILLR